MRLQNVLNNGTGKAKKSSVKATTKGNDLVTAKCEAGKDTGE